MASILTSKKLSTTQKKPLVDAGFELVEHDAIKIISENFKMPKEMKNAIFTSQNTVKALLNPHGRLETGIQNCFCVGQKTKALLEQKGMKIVAFAEYGKDLAEIIVEHFGSENFVFFCGNRRREELPSILSENDVAFEEVQVYKTELNPKYFQQHFEGILFFSPSAVESYIMGQKSKNTEVPTYLRTPFFCIGTTTASEAKKHTKNVVVAEEPTIESSIEQVLKYFKAI